jgi:hypothetical protein
LNSDADSVELRRGRHRRVADTADRRYLLIVSQRNNGPRRLDELLVLDHPNAAGHVLAEGGWEYIRYAAVSDGDYKLPSTGQVWSDPLGRDEGDYLSPRFPPDWYTEKQEEGYVWLSQFQGRPTAKEGAFFKVANLEIIPAAPANLRTVRAWDLAASTKGDYTVGESPPWENDG